MLMDLHLYIGRSFIIAWSKSKKKKWKPLSRLCNQPFGSTLELFDMICLLALNYNTVQKDSIYLSLNVEYLPIYIHIELFF